MSFLENVFKKVTLSDSRRSKRLDSPFLVAYYFDGATPTAHEIQNISSDGFFMLTEDSLRPGTVVTMTLQMSSEATQSASSIPHLTVMSMVVRQGVDGIGFAFIPNEPKDAGQSQDSGSRPAGRKAISKFLEQIKSDGGHMMIRFRPGVPKQPPSPQTAEPAKPKTKPMRRFADDSGQILITSFLAMGCLLGFVALAADVGIMMRQKRMAQTAADAAAIAGALELNYGTASVTSAGQAAAAQNGFTNGSNGVTVTINPPPLYGPHANLPGYVEAIVSIQQPTIFMGLFGVLNMTPAARAVATNGGGAANGCVYVLTPTGAKAMELQGSFTVTAPNCGVIVDSSDPGALQFTGGAGSLSAGSVGVVGGCGGCSPCSSCSDSNPRPVGGIVPQSDPLAGLISPPVPASITPACSAPTGGKLTGTLSNPAGGIACYSGDVTLSNVTLGAGTYVFTGNVTLDGNVFTPVPTIGSPSNGTTIDVDTGTLSINTGTTLNLNAPWTSSTACPGCSGVALMQPSYNSNQITIQKGDASGTVDGIIYAPSAKLFLQDSGGDKSGGLTLITDLIVGSLFDKTATLSIQSFSQSNPTGSLLTKIALVE